MARIVGFSLCQTPTGMCYDSIGPFIASLIEDSSLARPASIGMELEKPHKFSTGKNRHHSAQMLQVIEQLLATVIPGDGFFLLAYIFTGQQFMQRLGYLKQTLG